jgi:hypothetical protein
MTEVFVGFLSQYRRVPKWPLQFPPIVFPLVTRLTSYPRRCEVSVKNKCQQITNGTRKIFFFPNIFYHLLMPLRLVLSENTLNKFDSVIFLSSYPYNIKYLTFCYTSFFQCLYRVLFQLPHLYLEMFLFFCSSNLFLKNNVWYLGYIILLAYFGVEKANYFSCGFRTFYLWGHSFKRS